jgi:ribose 5-phosphate isomerase A
MKLSKIIPHYLSGNCMTPEEQKVLVAQAAVGWIMHEIPLGQMIGIGTGSTVNCLIDALAPYAKHFHGVVSSSEATTARLQDNGFAVVDPSLAEQLVVYVDGADEINPQGQMIKGGGGALTREKIVAAMAKQFICICDASKEVAVLGKFPLAIEVIPLASYAIEQQLKRQYGVQTSIRRKKDDPQQIFVTDNHGWIIDVHGLMMPDPLSIELALNQIPGVICNGIFAQHSADILIVSGAEGIRTIHF